jgi:hypothetical protein
MPKTNGQLVNDKGPGCRSPCCLLLVTASVVHVVHARHARGRGARRLRDVRDQRLGR